ncbi:hypothetical protein WEN_02325 [Mycoplasma wenyonii str. Massachusetts]|uniref:Uncharacterized protein n=1 Tax=Mycoplasma wenyonii (strain Massachusetts) TaxID=1197325 RepID=I6ZF86_MYCWM|nr:hypothetical protein [Mycoplasma wenyonii]AFN65252.1 hypothetical protein WEN_02325 [Mycoplasma wenyonii str. Massachusetts]
MVIPAVALKAFVFVIAGGTLVSSIVVPVTTSLNSSQTVSKAFPAEHKSKFKTKCQLLIKDGSRGSGHKKYLFACEKDSEGNNAEFFYYSEGDNPLKFTSLARNYVTGGEPDQTRVKITLSEGESQVDLTAKTDNWTGLIGQSLDNCTIQKNGDTHATAWTLKCPKEGDSENTTISLSPEIIN